jgi:hypothetical protein
VPITEDLRAWAAVRTPGLNLEHQRDLWLEYCRATDRRFADWPAALKGWLLKAHDRAQGNGHRLTAPAPTTPTHSSPNDEALEQFEDDWRRRYDRTYGPDAPPAAGDTLPATLPMAGDDAPPQDALSALLGPVTAGMRFPGEDTPRRPAAAPESERVRMLRAIREASQGQRSGRWTGGPASSWRRRSRPGRRGA